MKKFILLMPLYFILTGCLSCQEYSFEFNYDTGKVEKTYHGLRSQKGSEDENYSIEEDWNTLKKISAEEFGKDLDADVIKPVEAKLFQEDEALSGKEILQVQQPKAFPSKTAILERLHNEGDSIADLKFQILNGEILLFTHANKIKSANGKIIRTDKNNIVVWPEEQIEFRFTIYSNNQGGKSLLPFYLEEKKLEEKNKST